MARRLLTVPAQSDWLFDLGIIMSGSQVVLQPLAIFAAQFVPDSDWKQMNKTQELNVSETNCFAQGPANFEYTWKSNVEKIVSMETEHLWQLCTWFQHVNMLEVKVSTE